MIGKILEIKMEIHFQTDIGEVIKWFISIYVRMISVPYLIKVGKRFKWLHQFRNVYIFDLGRTVQRKYV